MNLTKARKAMKTRRDRFVVGYVRAKNVLVGKQGSAYMSALEPLTRKQAEKQLALMPCDGCAIFEIVPVEVNR